MIQSLKCDKFLILIESAVNAGHSAIVESIIQILKNSNRVDLDRLELVIRKRLINLCSKKYGLLLENEEIDY